MQSVKNRHNASGDCQKELKFLGPTCDQRNKEGRSRAGSPRGTRGPGFCGWGTHGVVTFLVAHGTVRPSSTAAGGRCPWPVALAGRRASEACVFYGSRHRRALGSSAYARTGGFFSSSSTADLQFPETMERNVSPYHHNHHHHGAKATLMIAGCFFFLFVFFFVYVLVLHVDDSSVA